MSKEKLLKAKSLIQNKQYDEARAILLTMPNHAIAQKWLAKLNEIAPIDYSRRSMEYIDHPPPPPAYSDSHIRQLLAATGTDTFAGLSPQARPNGTNNTHQANLKLRSVLLRVAWFLVVVGIALILFGGSFFFVTAESKTDNIWLPDPSCRFPYLLCGNFLATPGELYFPGPVWIGFGMLHIAAAVGLGRQKRWGCLCFFLLNGGWVPIALGFVLWCGFIVIALPFSPPGTGNQLLSFCGMGLVVWAWTLGTWKISAKLIKNREQFD